MKLEGKRKRRRRERQWTATGNKDDDEFDDDDGNEGKDDVENEEESLKCETNDFSGLKNSRKRVYLHSCQTPGTVLHVRLIFFF